MQRGWSSESKAAEESGRWGWRDAIQRGNMTVPGKASFSGTRGTGLLSKVAVEPASTLKEGSRQVRMTPLGSLTPRLSREVLFERWETVEPIYMSMRRMGGRVGGRGAGPGKGLQGGPGVEGLPGMGLGLMASSGGPLPPHCPGPNPQIW